MTKEKLKKEAVNWLRKYLLCCNCERKCNCIDSNSYCEEQVLKAYVDSAEPREKQIEIDAEQIRALQKQNGELTDKVKELEKENAELKRLKRECETSLCRAEYQYNYEQLTKAKEIIKEFMKYEITEYDGSLEIHFEELKKQAEQFLKD